MPSLLTAIPSRSRATSNALTVQSTLFLLDPTRLVSRYGRSSASYHHSALLPLLIIILTAATRGNIFFSVFRLSN